MTLPAYLDAVEQGRIPADEIAHETRIARTAFKEALAEAAMEEREAIADWHDAKALAIDCHVEHGSIEQIGWHQEAARTIRSRPAPAHSMADSPVPEPVVDAVNRVLRERGILLTADVVNAVSIAATIAVFTHWQRADLVAEAVRAEREACAVLLNEQADVLRAELTVWDEHEGSVLQAQIEAIEDAVSAIRSRPSPDVAVVPPVNDAAQSMIDSARGIGPGSWTSDDVTVPAPPPPDLAAMRRVVEAARQYRYDCENSDINAIERAQQDLFDLIGEVVRADDRAQEADHDR